MRPSSKLQINISLFHLPKALLPCHRPTTISLPVSKENDTWMKVLFILFLLYKDRKAKYNSQMIIKEFAMHVGHHIQKNEETIDFTDN